jgi:hypothetical protein
VWERGVGATEHGARSVDAYNSVLRSSIDIDLVCVGINHQKGEIEREIGLTFSCN